MRLVQVSPTQGTRKVLSEKPTGTKVVSSQGITVQLISLGGIVYEISLSKIELENMLKEIG